MTALVPRLSARETAAVVADVVAPLVARGVIVRRPRVTGALDRLDADRRAIRRLQRLRNVHGAGPVLLRTPGRAIALVLAPEHVRRVLDGTPDPFAAATREKRAALAHFEPHGVLISNGADRADRRRFNEAVLDTGHPVHGSADDFIRKVREEAQPLLARDVVGWDDFAVAWWRLVRRVVLGDGARDDAQVTDLLASLRRDANWAFLAPRRRRVRDRFLRRLEAYLARAEPGSLAARVASVPVTPRTDPAQQVPQWLFAFDAAGMAAFRALALLDAHPEVAEHADLADPRAPLLRATVLEALRLWPTTPAILREATADTAWEAGTLPAGAGLVVFAPFFHRDDERLPCADAFEPGLWSDGAAGDWPLIPFSAGPAECPGRDLVLLTTSTLLATLLDTARFRGSGLGGDRPLPATLSPFRLRFRVERRQSVSSALL